MRHDPRPPLALTTLLAILVFAGCGGSTSGTTATAGQPQFSGAEASPPQEEAPLSLHNYLGEPVDLKEFRGKAVLVTFIYTHCPDVCPLIVSHIKTALALLGPKARDVQVVAVSTDPRGDNRRTVTAFLREHGMTARMKYLIGSRGELGRVWKDWNIVAKPATAGRDLVEHSALIYGIGADGKVTTLYPANFKPSQLVHDVPLLAQE
ncbi:MAG TPA: SCO family protein [Solirubrobacterales bacterium]|nr:SCO family protein [Solirubrobacterales bacterium]